MGPHLHILSTAPRPQGSTHSPQRGCTMALGPKMGDYPTRTHTLDPTIPTIGMGLHRRLKYQGASKTGCRNGTHPNTHHHIHRCYVHDAKKPAPLCVRNLWRSTVPYPNSRTTHGLESSQIPSLAYRQHASTTKNRALRQPPTTTTT